VNAITTEELGAFTKRAVATYIGVDLNDWPDELVYQNRLWTYHVDVVAPRTTDVVGKVYLDRALGQQLYVEVL
jgi:hypothetical protein